MAGIDETIKSLAELSKLTTDLVGVIKAGGFRLSVLPAVFDMASEIKALVKDIPAALPELADLDAAEAGQVGAAAFSLVKQVIVAISTIAA